METAVTKPGLALPEVTPPALQPLCRSYRAASLSDPMRRQHSKVRGTTGRDPACIRPCGVHKDVG